MTTAILHQATMTSDTLRRALKSNIASQPYDWQATYPILAALDDMETTRSATIFPDDCPNTAHDAYLLNSLRMPIDTGLAIAQAAMLNIPAAKDDLLQRTNNPWFLLRPVHWQAGRDKVHLVALDDIDIQETKALLDKIGPWLAEWNWHVHITAPNQWFIRATEPFDFNAPSLEIAASDQLEHFLPHGNELNRWQTLLTEIQMAWFHHPVNQARQAIKKLPINSLWLDNASSAINWTQASVEEWQTTRAQIQTFSNHEVHAHLSELNAALAPILIEINRTGTSKLTFLGDMWQQDIVFKKSAMLDRIKHKMRTHKAAPLQWLETPKFDFLGR